MCASVEVRICLMHTKAESFLGVKGAVKMLCVFCAREEKEKPAPDEILLGLSNLVLSWGEGREQRLGVRPSELVQTF